MAEPEEQGVAAMQERMEQREQEATARIEEAAAANESATTALSTFMKEIVSAKRVLTGRDPASALLRARDEWREPGR